jgi:hypothetical protein
VPPSGIRKYFDLINEMKDAISLGIGVPDFVTPGASERRASIHWKKDIRIIPQTLVLLSSDGRSQNM